MSTYIAMLRGINIGPHKRMKMEKLRASCEALGFEEVKTYIQSGNVIFECNLSEDAVRARLEKTLASKMKKPIETTMLPIMAHEPISGFFSPSSLAISSRPTFRENFEATKPKRMAWPSVASPRTKGHPIHLCFSESRSRGSL